MKVIGKLNFSINPKLYNKNPNSCLLVKKMANNSIVVVEPLSFASFILKKSIKIVSNKSLIYVPLITKINYQDTVFQDIDYGGSKNHKWLYNVF